MDPKTIVGILHIRSLHTHIIVDSSDTVVLKVWSQTNRDSHWELRHSHLGPHPRSRQSGILRLEPSSLVF